MEIKWLQAIDGLRMVTDGQQLLDMVILLEYSNGDHTDHHGIHQATGLGNQPSVVKHGWKIPGQAWKIMELNDTKWGHGFHSYASLPKAEAAQVWNVGIYGATILMAIVTY